MSKRLFILFLLIVLSASSLFGMSPHFPGEGGPRTACCKAALEKGAQSNLPRLCCKLGCDEPGGTQSSASITELSDLARTISAVTDFVFRPNTDLYFRQIRFPNSPTRNIDGSSYKFLETGAFLI